ncbi:MAG: hypothetical protein H8K07_13055 [Nitrospira sp.]|nr:hypothetical protein [Nitrospira sp.]
MTPITSFSNPQDVANRGEQIYKEKFQAVYEKEHGGQYVVIDIATTNAYVAPFPEDALRLAKTDAPDGQFHLIRIGAPAAFKVSHIYAGSHRSV